ncbi:MAG: ATP-binding protein [Candidatus Omnitrophota bacterium]
MVNLRYRKILNKVIKFLDDDETIAIHGSRQVGKTSLLHYLIDNYLKKNTTLSNIFYFDLEDFALLDLCNQGPDEVIKYLKGKGADFNEKVYLLIDEIQYIENPSSFLKLCYDRYKNRIKMVVTGSSSFLVKKKFKDSLVGRIIDFELFPLDFEEFLNFKDKTYNLMPESGTVHNEILPWYEEYVLYGGYPAIVLEENLEKKEIKLKQILNTYVKKDIRDIASIRDVVKFNNLLRILASQSANLLNITELSNTLGISKETVENYIFILESTYIVKRIYPFHRNIRSELTKMPKMFFEDTGLLNILINKTFSQTITGQLLETNVYTLLRKNLDPENINFWRTNNGQEIDFILNLPRNKTVPVEVKSNYLKKHLRPLQYFLEQYSLAEGYLCYLRKSDEMPKEKVRIIFPWEIFRLF